MKQIKYGFFLVFLFLIAAIGVLTLDNRNEFSVEEGRHFTQIPELDYKKLTDTKYLGEIETALTDQLAGRESFISIYYWLQRNLLRESYIGDIVIGKDNYLFNKPLLLSDKESYKKNSVEKAAKEVNETAAAAAENGSKFIYLNMPRRDVSMPDKLPDYYPDPVQDYKEYSKIMSDTLSENVTYIDVKNLFEENSADTSYFWFKTDHHINPYGNELILNTIADIIKKDFPDLEVKQLEEYTLTKQKMIGALNRKIGLVVDGGEEPLNLTPRFDQQYTRMDNGRESDKKLFTMENTYGGAYMEGDSGETIVKTENKDAPSILYVGSSFTNPLEAMSVPSFSTVYSLDFRYNKSGKTLAEYIKEWKPDYVVFIPAQSSHTFRKLFIHNQLGLDEPDKKIEVE